MLAKTTVLEIVHDEGEQLQAAAHARAEAVYARDPEALRLLRTRDPPRTKRTPSPEVPTTARTRRRRRPPRR